MITWPALGIAVYSLYQLFSSENGAELAFSLVRTAVAIVIITAVKSQNHLVISAAVLLNVAAVLAAMAILRKEVQLKNDEP